MIAIIIVILLYADPNTINISVSLTLHHTGCLTPSAERKNKPPETQPITFHKIMRPAVQNWNILEFNIRFLRQCDHDYCNRGTFKGMYLIKITGPHFACNYRQEEGNQLISFLRHTIQID